MRKSYFYAVVGAGLLLAGCNSDPIMGNHKYQPIPVDIPENTQVTTPAQPATAKPAQVAVPQYVPMKDAVPSGGVDSVPGKKVVRKGGNSVTAQGGTYVIQRGDTPERIARKHKIKLSALMQANNLDEAKARRLQIGQKLTIPGKGAVVAPAANKKGGKAPAASSATPALENGKYKIQSGDSPERIARRFKVKLKDLLAANNLDEAKARRLQIGQTLIIPSAATAAEPKKEVKKEDKVVPPVSAADANSVEKTETPAANNAVDAEKKETPAEEESSEDSYDTLEATEDTTFAAVAAKYGISEAKLRDINAATPGATIKKGDWLLVPKK